MIDKLYSKIKQLNWRYVIKYSIGCYTVGIVVTLLYCLNDINTRGLKFKDLALDAILGITLISPIFLIIPFTILFGIIRALFNKKLILRWKMLIVCLSAVVGLQAYVMSLAEKRSIQWLPLFSLTDFKGSGFSDTYVTAKGTWISDTKLGTPIQATRIDCWRAKGIAIVTDAQLLWGGLSVNNSYYEIDKWTDDEITFKDSDQSMYCFYRLHIDRKNEAVTLTRFTKQPKPKEADDIQDEPIYMHLGDGSLP